MIIIVTHSYTYIYTTTLTTHYKDSYEYFDFLFCIAVLK